MEGNLGILESEFRAIPWRGYFPVPDSLTVRGPLEPLLLTVRRPARSPFAVGAKTTA
jgi:hypothetical protein